jgi:hypothetical protein
VTTARQLHGKAAHADYRPINDGGDRLHGGSGADMATDPRGILWSIAVHNPHRRVIALNLYPAPKWAVT